MTTRTPLRMRVLRTTLLSLVAGTMTVLGVQRLAHTTEAAVAIPPPAVDEPASDARSETAVFAGGCFWGVQGVFQHVKGVRKALSGYAGGERGNAHYELVGGGDTGHAESVQVTFDPREVTYGRLLQVYFSVAHDPTQLNRQGPDRGTSYRSAIFPQNVTQRNIATSYLAQLTKAKSFAAPIVTTLETGQFYAAEPEHQDFMRRNPRHPYIVQWDVPKVRALRTMYPNLVK